MTAFEVWASHAGQVGNDRKPPDLIVREGDHGMRACAHPGLRKESVDVEFPQWGGFRSFTRTAANGQAAPISRTLARRRSIGSSRPEGVVSVPSPADARGAGKRPFILIFTSSRHHVERRLCLCQIGGIEPLSEPSQGDGMRCVLMTRSGPIGRASRRFGCQRAAAIEFHCGAPP